MMSTGTLFFSSALGAEEVATPARRPPASYLTSCQPVIVPRPFPAPACSRGVHFVKREVTNFISTWAPGTVCVDLCIAVNKHPLLLPRGTGAVSHSAAKIWQLYFAAKHTTCPTTSRGLAKQNTTALVNAQMPFNAYQSMYIFEQNSQRLVVPVGKTRQIQCAERARCVCTNDALGATEVQPRGRACT